jgi:hypothetical protein
VHAVDPVVTRHITLGFGFVFSDTKRFEVNFPEGTIWYHTVATESLEFLLVADEVLHSSCDALRLNSLYPGSSKLST